MALVDQARLAGARKQLEEALGPLAFFEVVDDPADGADGDKPTGGIS